MKINVASVLCLRGDDNHPCTPMTSAICSNTRRRASDGSIVQVGLRVMAEDAETLPITERAAADERRRGHQQTERATERAAAGVARRQH